jgi:hypothetical protein
MIETREIRHFHLFGAIGGGAKGFNRGKARVGNLVGQFRCYRRGSRCPQNAVADVQK